MRTNPGEAAALHGLEYAAGTWDRERRVIHKAGHNSQGANPRLIVASLTDDGVAWRVQEIYDKRYCSRGEMENRVKEQQLWLFARRNSCHKFAANQFRLLLSSLHTRRSRRSVARLWRGRNLRGHRRRQSG